MAVNILVIHSVATRPGDPGSSRHFDLARRWTEDGHRVKIVHSPHSYLGARTQRAKDGDSELLEISGVQYEAAPFPWLGLSLVGRVASWSLFGFWVVLMARSRRFKVGGASADVVVGSSPDLFAALAASAVARALGVPFVLELRDLWPLSLIHVGGWSDRGAGVKVLGVLERTIYARADEIVMLMSNGRARVSAVLGSSTKPVTHIPNGVVVRSFPAEIASPREVGQFTIAYAGAMGRANHLRLAIEAASEIEKRWGPLVAWQLFGDGVSRRALESYAHELELRTVQFMGALPKPDVLPALSRADALFIAIPESPLYEYGVSPNKVYDYLAAARPLVVAGMDPEQIVETYSCGVVTSFDSAGVTDGVLSLLNEDPAELDRMGQRGREFVVRHRSMKGLSADYLRVLERAVGRGE